MPTEALKPVYGDGSGGPSADKAKQTLQAAGVTTPLEIHLQYNPEHYGSGSADEYGMIKDQLEASGLFKVDLQSTEYVQYSKDRVADVYPMYQLGWFPDYSDADNYLTPFFSKNNFLANHYDNPAVQKLITEQVGDHRQGGPDQDHRADPDDVAKDLSTLPLLQGAQVAVVGVQRVRCGPDPGSVVQVPLRCAVQELTLVSFREPDGGPGIGPSTGSGHVVDRLRTLWTAQEVSQ